MISTYAGIDLHSSNNFVGVINDKDKILYGKRHPNRLDAVRDLLRRRLLFVRHSTAHILSLQSMINRNLGFKMSNNEIKKMKPEDIEGLFACPNLVFMANNSLSAIKFLKKVSLDIEKKVKSQVKMRKEFEMLSNKLSKASYYIMRDQVAFDEDKLFSY